MSRPSPALIVALIALFVALGGTGYAAVKLNGKNIVNRSITAKKLKRDTLGGREVNEAKLGKVPSAAHSDTAARADSANSAVSARIASDALKLGNRPASAYLLNTDKAMNADMLDGMDSADFLKARGAGPVVLEMPAIDGEKVTQPLFTNGPLTVVGECENDNGGPVARIGVTHDVEAFVLVGDTAGKVTPQAVSPGTVRTIVEVAATGGLPVWDGVRRDFTVVSNPLSGAAALQGQASAVTNSGFGATQCYVSAWAFAS